MFLKMLITRLDYMDVDWRRSTILVMDNASIHTGGVTKAFIAEHNLPVLMTGVASFLALPVERVFGLIKRRLSDIWEDKLSKIREQNARQSRVPKIDQICDLIDQSVQQVSP